MQLWRKAMSAVWNSSIPWSQKLYLNLFFFGTRMFSTHIVSFMLYCTLVPIAVLAPEARSAARRRRRAAYALPCPVPSPPVLKLTAPSRCGG